MRYLPYLLLACLSFACEKENLSVSNTADLPVVQAYLFPGLTPEMKIFRQAPFEVAADTLPTINGLDPIIAVDGVDYLLTQNTGGSYVAPAELVIEAGKTYTLSFEHEGSMVNAATPVPAKPVGFSRSTSTLDLSDFPFSASDPVTLSWENPENDFHQILIEYAETDSTELELFSGRPSDSGGPGAATSPQQTNTFDVRPLSVSYVGTHRAILYRVTADYAVFAQDDGGTSVNLTAPFTNVENGLGIFTGVSADTLTFIVRE